jgi:hypothetical protein
MAANPAAPSFIEHIGIPLLLASGWAVLGIATDQWTSPIVEVVWLSVRVVLVAWAGYLVTRRGNFGLLSAAGAGAVMNFADHVIVKGGYFVLVGEFMAAGGVLISYVMFVWVAIAVALLGGALGKVRASRGIKNAAI